MKIKTLLVDDHVIMRQGLGRLIDDEPDMCVVGEAGDGLTALSLCKRLSPDIVIMDISMPGLNGIDTTLELRKKHPAIKVIALTMHHEMRFLRQMVKAGSWGHLLKDCSADEILRALRSVAQGKIYICAAMHTQVASVLFDEDSSQDSQVPALCPQERKVLQYIAEGKRTREIASLLRVSIKTVSGYRVQINKKLNTNNTADLTKYALIHGLTCLNN